MLEQFAVLAFLAVLGRVELLLVLLVVVPLDWLFVALLELDVPDVLAFEFDEFDDSLSLLSVLFDEPDEPEPEFESDADF